MTTTWTPPANASQTAGHRQPPGCGSFSGLTEHAASVFEVLLFAIIGVTGGLSLARLPSNCKNLSPSGKMEQPPSQVLRDE